MKLLLTILTLISTCQAQKYTASWTGWGHLSYQVQQGRDSLSWSTIGNVTGSIASANYSYTIPAANYYYRVKADKDTTKALYLPETLDIKNPPPAKGKTKVQIQSLSVKVLPQMHFIIESPRSEQLEYNLYDIAGRKLSHSLINVFIGTNEFHDSRPIIQGVYYATFQGYFDFIPVKIIR
ncbi:MAG TPA: hypothetical protein VN726_22880 [Hanamia sp.]|nr:hypothetical protein [Hanamia sp.]